MPKLAVNLFGKLTIQRDGYVLNGLPAGKLQELLCYLLLHRDRDHPRESLASLLWGEHVTVASKKYLRQALWQLQSTFSYGVDNGERPIVADHDSVCLRSAEPLWIDVAAFEKAARHLKRRDRPLEASEATELKEAVALYRADLLEGWYQDWCLVERERLQNICLGMLGRLMSYSEQHQEYDAGLEFGERILSTDRAHERTYQAMMRLHQLAGDRASALRVYQRCATALQEELGVAPAQSTLSLLEQIRSDRQVFPLPTKVSSDAASPEPGLSNKISLVELVSRLRQLMTALSELQQHVQNEVHTVERLLP